MQNHLEKTFVALQYEQRSCGKHHLAQIDRSDVRFWSNSRGKSLVISPSYRAISGRLPAGFPQFAARLIRHNGITGRHLHHAGTAQARECDAAMLRRPPSSRLVRNRCEWHEEFRDWRRNFSGAPAGMRKGLSVGGSLALMLLGSAAAAQVPSGVPDNSQQAGQPGNTPYTVPDLTKTPPPAPNLLSPISPPADGYLRTEAYGTNLLPIAPTIGNRVDYQCLGGCPSSYFNTLGGVIGRKRPLYDPAGIPLGGFLLFPTLELAGSFDDNVYYSDTNKQSDIYFTAAPNLNLKSQWSQSALELFAGLREKKFASLSTEDLTDWDVGGTGRLDIVRGADISVSERYDSMHEPRYSPDSTAGQKAPTPFQTQSLTVSADYLQGEAGLQVGATYQQYTFSPTEMINAAPQSNTDRNRAIYTGFAKATYQFSPGYSFYVQSSYDNHAYELAIDRFGLDRNSTGYATNGGLSFVISHLIVGDVFVGYEKELYRGVLKDVGGLDFGGEVHWYATNLITVNLKATHAITDTTTSGNSASNDETVTLSADYELLRNLILQSSLTYEQSKYVGLNPFTLNEPSVDFGASYLINNYASAEAHYSFESRTSNGFPGFSRNVFTIGLMGHI